MIIVDHCGFAKLDDTFVLSQRIHRPRPLNFNSHFIVTSDVCPRCISMMQKRLSLSFYSEMSKMYREIRRCHDVASMKHIRREYANVRASFATVSESRGSFRSTRSVLYGERIKKSVLRVLDAY